ncbi:hypothetical protein Ae406Ps2_6001c [Pseudonocardia sp. Ae406_Ps2]|nr:hypothetical protein Ae406Ps2_6001c [Pseudonocardia sp. Ae406_Ps2]OLM08695.1 hypothetical protein Ae505Ps2_6082c [Pseudonocardia sp. Ae505_Ps2]
MVYPPHLANGDLVTQQDALVLAVQDVAGLLCLSDPLAHGHSFGSGVALLGLSIPRNVY